MNTNIFVPDQKYLTKNRIIFSSIALGITGFAIFLTTIITLEEGRGGLVAFPILMGFNLVWYAIAMGLSGPYYRSLKYEVQDDEVIVNAGIVTKSVKHVPYRTVTNLTVKRDIIDRMLGIGTLNIQTAGMSGTTGAEESLVGLPNVQAVYEQVVTELRRFRGGMSPTMADEDAAEPVDSAQALNAILAELKAIRSQMEK